MPLSLDACLDEDRRRVETGNYPVRVAGPGNPAPGLVGVLVLEARAGAAAELDDDEFGKIGSWGWTDAVKAMYLRRRGANRRAAGAPNAISTTAATTTTTSASV